jgi:hypothetical protein
MTIKQFQLNILLKTSIKPMLEPMLKTMYNRFGAGHPGVRHVKSTQRAAVLRYIPHTIMVCGALNATGHAVVGWHSNPRRHRSRGQPARTQNAPCSANRGFGLFSGSRQRQPCRVQASDGQKALDVAPDREPKPDDLEQFLSWLVANGTPLTRHDMCATSRANADQRVPSCA